MSKKLSQADFAGGCFWGIEDVFLKLPGVVKTEVGYEGGEQPKPTYAQVCSHITGHAETVRVTFNPGIVSYEDLLRRYMAEHDPTQLNRQGPDVGENYRSAIFYHNEDQHVQAKQILDELNQSGKYDAPIVTQVVLATTFWPAEGYHQQYFAKRRGEA